MQILIIEDDKKIASFVARGLKQAGFKAEIASCGQEALALIEKRQYAALIVDLMLPDFDGYEVIKQLRNKKIKIPILILSAKSELEDKLKGFASGSDDYLTKPFSFAELEARLKALLKRSSQESLADELKAGDLYIDLVKRKVRRGKKTIELRPREYELLVFLVKNAGNVVTKTMIMEQIWNYYFDPGTNVVDVLVHRLRSKIDTGFDKKLIQTVRGLGYVFKVI